MSSLTLGEVLDKSQEWLRARGVDQPRLDAEQLVRKVLGLDRLQLILQRERLLEESERLAIRELVQRRGAREPLAWILGHKGFHELDLRVHKGVLVPRADTETLVLAALERIPEGQELFVADVGCGSGAIGLAIAAARPLVKVYAIDLSDEALENTRDNVTALGLQARVAVLKGDLLAPVPPSRPIDLVLSNPPYIERAVIDGLDPEVARFEPRLALDGGPDGLEVYRRLIPQARARARLGLIVEIGHDQGAAVQALFREASFVGVEQRRDLGGRDRIVLGTVPGASWATAPDTGEWSVELFREERAPAVDEEGNPLPVIDAER